MAGSVSFACLLVVVCVHFANGVVRDYYIAAVEQKWDYAPTNMSIGEPIDKDDLAAVFSKNDPTNRIGKVYNKAIYRECTDPSCTKMKDHPKYLGFLGPIFRAEVGDTLHIHFTNLASRRYSVHPHGVFYRKDSEGALYEDKTSGKDKEDDGVPPNEKYTYVWEVKKEHGPTQGDSDCLTWAYHSHIDPFKDINTGLIGALIICKKGTFINNKHKDIDKDFVLLLTVTDENKSWLLDKNIREFCPQFNSTKDDEDFKESNKMHVINGYFYANTPGLEMCSGDRVDWHVFGMGGEVDIHTVFFHGQTVTVDGHRTDVGSVFPASSLTAHMTAITPGSFLVNCLVNDHLSAGMLAYYNVTNCPGKKAPTTEPLTGETRNYYIAAEERLWDYAPSGMDNFNGGNLTSERSRGHVFFARGNDSIGGKYWKALFVEYTDDTFTKETNKDPSLGFMGPVIRAEVGDTINVVFTNKASHMFNMDPHGVLVVKNTSRDGYFNIVQPNKTVKYLWTVPEHVGPTKNDPACITYVYTSAVHPIKDVYSGLIGPLLVCKKGALDKHGIQKNINKEFVLLFSVMNENAAWYIDRNAKEFAGSSYEHDPEKESNLMHGLNGYLFANLPSLDMCVNDTVSWHLIGFGNEVDIHGAYFHGQTFLSQSNRKDSVHLVPGTFRTVIMQPDNPGEWAVVCRTNDHHDAGMVAKFRVHKCDPAVGALRVTPKKRTYYIAAVELDWDYAPTGRNILGNTTVEEVKKGLKRGPLRIGRVYKKAVYREFTDGSFTKERKQPEYFGLLGPMIKAEVGETIEVVFKNNASRVYSIHPHGVLYDKSNEGALYLDNTTLKDDDLVKPGETYTYMWGVPARAGPSETDDECLTWMYYSNVDPSRDTNTGLLGPLIICRKGSLKEGSLKPKNVDHEFPLYFTMVDENLSWYLDDNIQKFTGTPQAVDKDDDDFQSSNQIDSINGLVYGNLEGLTMDRGDRVNWYLMSLGTEEDMHTVHFHGQTVLHRTVTAHKEDVINLFPGVFVTVKMVPDSVGYWLLHCHVNEHLKNGMEARFQVQDEEAGSGSGSGVEPSENPTSSANYAYISAFVTWTYLIFWWLV